MVKSKAVTAFSLVLLCLLASSAVHFRPVKAQNQVAITINADGSITPLSSPISQNGDSYTLTTNFNGMVTVSRSNITLNGNGHTINQYATTQDEGNAFGIYLDHVYNVTVTNITITNTGNGVYGIEDPTAAIYIEYGGSNTVVGNNLANNYNAMDLLETNNNIVVQNNFTDSSSSAVSIAGGSYNLFYHNNFIDNKIQADVEAFSSQPCGNMWDNGKEGNFWSDYNGTENDNTGIGDQPYFINTHVSNTLIIDNYPLMKPYTSELQPKNQPTPAPTAMIPESTAVDTTTIPFSTLVSEFIVILVVVLIVLISLLLYHRRARVKTNLHGSENN